MQTFTRFQKLELQSLSPGDRFYKSGDSAKVPHTLIEHQEKNSLVKSDRERHPYLLGKKTIIFFLRHKF